MKKSIRKILYGTFLFIFICPGIVSAQWDEGMMRAKTSYLPEGSVGGILFGLMNWLMSLVGILGVIAFAISGIMYLTAFGDETRAENAKKTMTWAIVGVVVALMGYVIIKTIDAILQGRGYV